MTTIQTLPGIPFWKRYLLRLSIVFILLLSVPLQVDFYQQLLGISWQYLLSDLFNLVIFLPHFFGDISGFADWFLLLAIAALVAGLWTVKGRVDPGREASLYYFLRIFVRFRLAAILSVAGLTKLFAIFAPALSLSHLNTPYGYFEDWKQLYLSLSAAPAYVIFLGVIELLATVLLLFRRTSFLAVLIIIPFYGNVFLADLAYGGRHYLASAFTVLLTLPIFFYDAKRLAQLVIQFDYTSPQRWQFDWSQVHLGYSRWIFKLLFVLLFIGLAGFKSYEVSKTASLYYPEQPGLPGIAGKYLVDEFIINGDTIPFSPANKQRWRDVVFEQWNTLSVRINDAIKTAAPAKFLADQQRDYEYTQVGGRLYYRYTTAPNRTILLKNPNPAYPNDSLRLQLLRPDSTHIQLYGTNSTGDTLSIALQKVNKKYLLYEVGKRGRDRLGFKL
ncbi:hypothetical protein [Sphingobacterium sp. HMA12]|uniref:hypothetical protein n=1 Tax=Sphingobacterium sp. HMA12 TaxID=2050894 RepID=UPI000CE9EC30|nr:hypothetical protein [Sphingobacterium sp. HMA12]